MHNQMQEEMNQQQSAYGESSSDKQKSNSKNSSPKEQSGDYIDFEEVK